MPRNLVSDTVSAVLAATVAIGLVGAFIGISVSSYWYDELFTKWVTAAPNIATFKARALSDVHPPTYYFLTYVWTLLAGASDADTRVFSAICSVWAIIVFLWTAPFSLNGRLFSSSLASSSIFWFYQSQNARSYALSLLLVSLLTSCLFDILRGKTGNFARTRAISGILLLIVSLTHLYGFYVALAALSLLFLIDTDLRRFCVSWAAVVFLAVFGHYLLIVRPMARFDLTKSWISGDASWFILQTVSAWKETYGLFGTLAVMLCGFTLLIRIPTPRLETMNVAPTLALLRQSKPVVVCAGVPLLVLMAGVVGSLLSPNFTNRNFLVVSPFLWGFTAWLYDAAVQATKGAWRHVLSVGTAVLATLSSTLVASRNEPHNEPFRESARWIQKHSRCGGAVIPVIRLGNVPTRKYEGFQREIEAAAYGHYLNGFSQPRSIFSAELTPGKLSSSLIRELRDRMHSSGCPIVGWVAHGAGPAQARMLSVQIMQLTNGTPGTLEVRSFEVRAVDLYHYTLLDRVFRPKPNDLYRAYVFYRR